MIPNAGELADILDQGTGEELCGRSVFVHWNGFVYCGYTVQSRFQCLYGPPILYNSLNFACCDVHKLGQHRLA